ncbi:MAG: sodium:proton antiporter [Fusobacteriales bacterium]|nr:MAG: sodium:proton antiporter [Fusobacteriales bacterium]
MKEKIKPNFKGLIPFIIFIVLYLGAGISLKNKGVELPFYQLPGPIAAFVGIVAAFLIFKGNFEEKANSFLEGCGHRDIILMCIIYLLAGAFAVVSKSMGGVEATVNLGMNYISPNYLAVGLFLITAFISTSIGTSVGSIVAIGPIAVGLAEKSGVALPLILAAVMGGAMFGDNLSIISDTTIAATRTQNVEMRDKFKVNFFIAMPAAIVTIMLLVVYGRPEIVPEVLSYKFNFIKVIPYIFVLFMAIIGLNVFVVLTSGILLSGLIGFIYKDFTLLAFGKEIYSGFTNMTEIFLLSMLMGGLAQLVTKEGGIQWIIKSIEKIIKGKKSAKLGIGILVGLVDVAVANNTVAILINGEIAKKIAEKYQVDLRESAALLDIFSCVAQGVIPHGAQMLILLGFSQGRVSPVEIIPLLWYQIILGLFTIVYIFTPKLSEKIILFLDNKK